MIQGHIVIDLADAIATKCKDDFSHESISKVIKDFFKDSVVNVYDKETVFWIAQFYQKPWIALIEEERLEIIKIFKREIENDARNFEKLVEITRNYMDAKEEDEYNTKNS